MLPGHGSARMNNNGGRAATTRKQFKEIESRKHSGNVFLCPENEENGAKKHIYYPFFLFQNSSLGLCTMCDFHDFGLT